MGLRHERHERHEGHEGAACGGIRGQGRNGGHAIWPGPVEAPSPLLVFHHLPSASIVGYAHHPAPFVPLRRSDPSIRGRSFRRPLGPA